ncbi:ClpP/crotonase [Punctularia strigosozonata HHB-11173 SS5]|uniref:ClpP/crotonase n=1 Tax=Punctularia strigosozonata (strain HHB-11173) TaxID=741275 RepID=UPI0004416CD6|nr:ClpP/crotonase [Punctularia strigosozonata HHB-11173 SS5]EIN09726.1 ClpP/crotonase [Punctularia strigosozonata HHB-11173 SS5]
MSYPLSLPSEKPLLTVTHPSSSIWVIEMHNGEDSRITPTFIDHGFKPALDLVEKEWRDAWHQGYTSGNKDLGAGALIIVGNRKQDKFFSNATLNPFLRRLLTFPIPTVAAINGHCFAAGMMISLCCDYRVMTDASKRRAWMCMNEVHFGAAWPESFVGLLRGKVGSAQVHRQVAVEGYRFTPQEALKAGLVDVLVEGGSDTEAVLAKAQQVAQRVSTLAKEGSLGLIKATLYPDIVKSTKGDLHIPVIAEEHAVARARL